MGLGGSGGLRPSALKLSLAAAGYFELVELGSGWVKCFLSASESCGIFNESSLVPSSTTQACHAELYSIPGEILQTSPICVDWHGQLGSFNKRSRVHCLFVVKVAGCVLVPATRNVYFFAVHIFPVPCQAHACRWNPSMQSSCNEILFSSPPAWLSTLGSCSGQRLLQALRDRRNEGAAAQNHKMVQQNPRLFKINADV